MRIRRSKTKILYRTHTAFTLYLSFMAAALPPASYDATAASPPPPPAAAACRLDEAETEGAWVRRWDAVAGGAGADWATCLRLLERAAADVALDGCGGRCLFVPGGELNEIKKSKTNVFALYGRLPAIQTQQPTKNTRTRRRR